MYKETKLVVVSNEPEDPCQGRCDKMDIPVSSKAISSEEVSELEAHEMEKFQYE